MISQGYSQVDASEDKPLMNGDQKVYRRFGWWDNVKRFIGRRLAWTGVSLLSAGASFFTALKGAANLFVGLGRNTVGAAYYYLTRDKAPGAINTPTFNSEYFIEAGKNFVSSIGYGLLSIVTAIGFIAPSIPSSLARLGLLPSTYLLNKLVKEKDSLVADKETPGISGEKKYMNKEFSTVDEKLEAAKHRYIYTNKFENENALKRQKDVEVPSETIYFKRGGVDNVYEKYDAPKRIFRDVKAENEVVDTVEVPCERSAIDVIIGKSVPYCISFSGNAGPYQMQYHRSSALAKRLNLNVIAFNYSGISTPNSPESVHEIVNDGIAQVYALKERMKWTWKQVEENVNFHGFSLGGAVALQVREHFINQTKPDSIYIKTFVDRSFRSLSDVVTEYANIYTGLPKWMAKPVATLALYGAGDWEIDSVASLKRCGDKNVNYINLVSEEKVEVPSFWQKVKNFFGLGEASASPDPGIPGSSTLMAGLVEAAEENQSTAKILGNLAVRNAHAVTYTPPEADEDEGPSNPHGASLARLHPVADSKQSGWDVYKTLVQGNDESGAESMLSRAVSRIKAAL